MDAFLNDSANCEIILFIDKLQITVYIYDFLVYFGHSYFLIWTASCTEFTDGHWNWYVQYFTFIPCVEGAVFCLHTMHARRHLGMKYWSSAPFEVVSRVIGFSISSHSWLIEVRRTSQFVSKLGHFSRNIDKRIWRFRSLVSGWNSIEICGDL